MAEIEEDEPPGVPEWVVTYGDMMSLLLTFFIMLVSMSEMKQDGAMRAMLDAIKQSFGNQPITISGVPGPSMQTNSYYKNMVSNGRRSESDVNKGSKDSEGNLGENSTVDRINHGTVVTIGGPSMFAPFDAELNDDIRMRLDILADIIRNRPNRICIRGHSSPEPLPAGSPYRDQFELSYARARAVADYFISEKKIPQDRIIVGAAGDTEQRMMTRNSKMQSQNHRVDVFLIDAI